MAWTDNFDDSDLDTDKFGTSVNGATVISEGANYLTIDEGAAAADAGIVYLQNKISLTLDCTYVHRVRCTSIEANKIMTFFGVIYKTTAPVVEANTTWNPRVRIQVYYNDNSNLIYIYYMNDSSVPMYWKGATNEWTTDVEGAVAGWSVNDWAKVEFIVDKDAGTWKIIFYDGSDVKLEETDVVNLTSLLAPRSDLWIWWGDPYTSHYYLDGESDYFSKDEEEVAASSSDAGIVGFAGFNY
jgi:hypothetical protein